MNILKIGSALLCRDADDILKGIKRRWADKVLPEWSKNNIIPSAFDDLYLVPDPWSLASDIEAYRYTESNHIISGSVGHSRSLLEVGCGEGLQSCVLRQLTSQLYGIDISKRAINRAQRRCPESRFFACDFADPPPALPRHFDVVTAFEILYYLPNIPKALAFLSELGSTCFVSYYDGAKNCLDPHLQAIPGIKFWEISRGDYSWTIAYWRNVPGESVLKQATT